MAYTYKGKGITGTSTSDIIFTKSGVKYASVNQTYFNVETGHVYVCTVAGNASTAKWRYWNTGIAKKPDMGVSKLGVPSRYAKGGNTRMVKAEWHVPKWLVNEINGARAEGLEITWILDVVEKKAKKDPHKVIEKGNEKATKSSINLNSFKVGKTVYTRSSFYPFTGKHLRSVTVKVRPTNSKGDGKVVASQTLEIKPPRAPSISAPAFDANTGRVSATITTNAGTDKYERYDTAYSVEVYDSRTKKTVVPNGLRGASVNTEIPLAYDVSGYQGLGYDDYIRVTFKACARGYMGDTDAVPKVYYVGYPAQANIKSISAPDKSSAGKATVYINTNSTKEHPVDQVKLEYLANVPYATAEAIPGDESWASTNIVDNASCTALALPVAELLPDKGKHTWLRVRSFHAAENVLYRYSNYKEAKSLFTPAPTAADDEITIISAVAGAGGTSAVVHLGWNADGQDDSDGTELSWATEEDAWKSTKEPDRYEFEWSDGKVYEKTQDESIVTGKKYYTRSGEGTPESPYVYTLVQNPSSSDLDIYYEVEFNDGATITIKGLSEGAKYYIKARRYMEGETKSFSPYSNPASVMTNERPESVVATCDGFIPVGDPLQVYWTFSGNGLQTKWRVVSTDEVFDYKQVVGPTGDPSSQGYYELINDGYVLTSDTTVDEEKTYYAQETNGTVIASGEGSIGSAQIPADRLSSFAVDGVVTLKVEVATGNDFVSSEAMKVAILDKPVLSIAATSPLEVQPLGFTATVTRISDLIVIVTSQGASGQWPEGMLMQTSGDTIYSDVIAPTWEASGNVFSANIVLPTGLDFWDLGKYEVSAVAVDRTTGLKSNEMIVPLEIAWANQAKDPDVTITPINETDEEGIHHLAVDIALAPPEECSLSDLYDIYRMDGGSAHLIGQSFPIAVEVKEPEDDPSEQGYYEVSGDTFVLTEDTEIDSEKTYYTKYIARDEYAPFGEMTTLYYRVALRTVDGDVAYSDFEYVLENNALRFDWAGGSLELPYNIGIEDSYSKDFQLRQHLDGSVDGYWNPNIERKGSLSTDVIDLVQSTEIELARQLAKHSNAVFVRTPDGSAYEANVQITSLSKKNAAVTSIAIDATEIGLTQEFALPTPYVFEEEEES